MKDSQGTRRLLLWVALIFICFSPAICQKTIPELWGQRIHDETNTLSTGAIDLIEKELAAYEDSTSNQIAILIIHSLDGEAIEDYSVKVADKWKLGTKKNDNGVLMLIAVDDHAMRIEVGKGLEGVLTDAISSEIIRNELAPNFRRGDYETGIRSALQSIKAAIGGEYHSTSIASSTGDDDSLLSKIFTALITFVPLFIFTLTALFSTGCAGWGVYAFLIPFYAFFPWVTIGALAGKILFGLYVIGFPIGKVWIGRTKWGKREIENLAKIQASSGGGRRSGGGWLGGAGGLISGAAGGFIGGGGGFGGGGASGSW